MGDRVAILRDGVLQQLGTPDEIYDRPVNVFVAGFIGSPSMNLITARLAGTVASFGNSSLDVGERPGLSAYDGREVVLGLRPEDIGVDGAGSLELAVNRVESLGSELMVYLDSGVPGLELTARLERRADAAAGKTVKLPVDLERLYFFDTESGAAIW